MQALRLADEGNAPDRKHVLPIQREPFFLTDAPAMSVYIKLVLERAASSGCTQWPACQAQGLHALQVWAGHAAARARRGCGGRARGGGGRLPCAGVHAARQPAALAAVRYARNSGLMVPTGVCSQCVKCASGSASCRSAKPCVQVFGAVAPSALGDIVAQRLAVQGRAGRACVILPTYPSKARVSWNGAGTMRPWA